MKRTKIKDRCLPKYCKQEEILNAISHGIGASVAIAALILCVIKSGDLLALTGALIYGISLFLVYGISATYHGFPAGNIKKVFAGSRSLYHLRFDCRHLYPHTAMLFCTAATCAWLGTSGFPVGYGCGMCHFESL